MTLPTGDSYAELVAAAREFADSQEAPPTTAEVRSHLSLNEHSLSHEETEGVLTDAGYETDDEHWYPRWVPIIGTGDVDPFEFGGGVLLYYPEKESFRWAFWEGPTGEGDAAVYDMGWVIFAADDDLTSLVNMDELAAYVGKSRATLEELAEGTALGQLEFLQNVVVLLGASVWDGSKSDVSIAQLRRRFDLPVRLVAGRGVDDAEMVLDALGLLEPDEEDEEDEEGEEDEEDLDLVNAHRQALGMAPVVVGGGAWTTGMVADEARRIRAAAPGDPLLSARCPRAHVEYVVTRMAHENWHAPVAGGFADGQPLRAFSFPAILAGTCVELEHTGDVRVAVRIAMDHLVESPDYYVRLRRMEGAGT